VVFVRGSLRQNGCQFEFSLPAESSRIMSNSLNEL
jgi:hypothetical protein